MTPDIDDDAWLYLAQPGAVTTRRLRVWSTGRPAPIAVVTETAASAGTSITNAAEAIRAQLTHELGADVVIVEHYPDAPDGPTWDQVGPDATGRTCWSPTTPEALGLDVP